MLMGDIQHVKRRRKVFRVLATCLPKKKTPTTRESREGEGIHALPQGNVIMMLGSQLTASG